MSSELERLKDLEIDLREQMERCSKELFEVMEKQKIMKRVPESVLVGLWKYRYDKMQTKNLELAQKLHKIRIILDSDPCLPDESQE